MAQPLRRRGVGRKYDAAVYAPQGNAQSAPERGRVPQALSRSIPGPRIRSLSRELDQIAAAAWDAYAHSRKAPRTYKAGSEFADPDYKLSVDWLAARAAIAGAQRRYAERSKLAILLINGSSRGEHICPGEMSKSYRLVEIARDVFAAAPDVTVELLDLSRLASEYGRHIHPCKACFSTAAAPVTGPARAIPIIRWVRRMTG